MARALVWSTRQSNGTWRPVGVFLGTRRRLDGRCLAGDPERSRWFLSILDDAQRPQKEPYSPERGTWEDWIGWALSAHSNGHDGMMAEVPPELTADALYQREVLGITPGVLGRDGSPKPSDDVPPLTGVKADKIRPTAPTARA